MSKFQAKVEKSNRQATVCAIDRHGKWREAFFACEEWQYDTENDDLRYYPESQEFRNHAPSRNQKQALAAYRRIEEKLTKLYIKLKSSKVPIAGLGSAEKMGVFLKAFRSDIGFADACLKNVTKGRVKVIPNFIAEMVLAGLKLYSDAPDPRAGRELMREFFRSDGEFRDWIEKMYGYKRIYGINTDELVGENLVRALCGKKDGKPIGVWTKYFGELAFENISLAGDDPKKSNKDRSLKGAPKEKGMSPTPAQVAAKERTAKIDKRISDLARSILDV